MFIRTANESDSAEIARIHVDTWRVAYAGIVPDGYLSRLSKNNRAQKWSHTLSESTKRTRVAIGPDGEVIGWTSFGPSRDDDNREAGELYAIYLDPSHWGKGIGRNMMTDAVSHLQNDGFHIITLWVLEDNTRTRAFYEKAGFIHDGTRKAITIDGKNLTELRYRKNAQQGAEPDASGAG